MGTYVAFHIGTSRAHSQTQIHVVGQTQHGRANWYGLPGQTVKSRAVPVLVVVQYDAVHMAQEGKSPSVFLAFFAMGGKAFQAVQASPSRFQHVGGQRVVVQHGATAHIEHFIVGQVQCPAQTHRHPGHALAVIAGHAEQFTLHAVQCLGQGKQQFVEHDAHGLCLAPAAVWWARSAVHSKIRNNGELSSPERSRNAATPNGMRPGPGSPSKRDRSRVSGRSGHYA